MELLEMNETKSTLSAKIGGAEITRFNALRHGVLSRYIVLPWEDAATNSVKYGRFPRLPGKSKSIARTELETSSSPGPSMEVLRSLHRLAKKGSAIFLFAPL
jgi:hypothetical protein